MDKYDSIIFDLDGTLWNASKASARGWNLGLSMLGFNDALISEKDMDQVSGKPSLQCVQEVLAKYSVPESDQLIEAMNAQEKVILESEGGILYEGVLEGLKKLSEKTSLYLISNCQDWYLDSFWKHFPVKSYFVASDCNGIAGVPKAEMISNMVNKYELYKPIYIGDTEGDELASRLAGVDFGFVEYGFGAVQNPNEIFKYFKSIVDWIDV